MIYHELLKIACVDGYLMYPLIDRGMIKKFTNILI
jgi:hypothetical protein